MLTHVRQLLGRWLIDTFLPADLDDVEEAEA